MPFSAWYRNQGVTLVEMIVFIVVISVALLGIGRVFTESLNRSVDPIVQITAIELAQAKLDQIQARKFADNTPTGGVPACGSAEPGAAVPCAVIVGPDAALNDVGDYDGESVTSGLYTIATSVVAAGSDLGLDANQARRITVTVTMPGGEQLTLSSYKVNF